MAYQLPPDLADAIRQEADRYPGATIAHLVRELSNAYRGDDSPRRNPSWLAAYAVARLPATYGVTARLLSGLDGESLLDLGAGPGTAAWAVREVLPSVTRVTLAESDERMIELGKKLGAPGAIEWKWADIRRIKPMPPHDIVLASYSLGELTEEEAVDTAREAWSAARRWLVIVEPGTPRGFERILRLRAEFVDSLAAPCPHRNPCPAAAPDWCHFAERIMRSSAHRRAKGGSLPYEDEKFSYLIAAKEPSDLTAARIVRHPQVNPGFIKIDLCGPGGLSRITVTKKSKEAWRDARHAKWGDAWTHPLVGR